MKNIIINPVTNEYESTLYKHKPTTSDLMKEIGRPDVAAAIDKVTKKKITGFNNKTVGALDVASAECRDILSEQLMYKWDSSSGKFFNGNGQSVDSAAEANKLNDETAIVAPGGEGKQFNEQYKKDNSQPTKIPKIKKKDSYQDDWQVMEQAMSEEEKRAFYTDKKLKGYKMETANEKKYSKTVPVKIDFSLRPKIENVNENFTTHLDNINTINEIAKQGSFVEGVIGRDHYYKKSDPDLKYGLRSLMGVMDE